MSMILIHLFEVPPAPPFDGMGFFAPGTPAPIPPAAPCLGWPVYC